MNTSIEIIVALLAALEARDLKKAEGQCQRKIT
jgi:hypothetical protein